MRPLNSLIPCFLGTILFTGFAAFLTAQSVPENGLSVLGAADPINTMSFRAGSIGGQPIAARSVVDVAGQPFTRAFRIEVIHPGTNFWDSALNRGSSVAVAKDDVALFHAFIRKISSADESGLVSVNVYVEGPGPAYSKSISTTISAGDEWTEIFLPFTFNDDYPSGSINLNLGFGQTGKTMTMEIGGIELLNYAKTRTLVEMPRTKITYPGQEADAPWRAEATARIEQFRKGDLAVKVVDADGHPIPGATVRVEMLRHDFKFSSVTTSARLTGTTEDDRIYREKVLELFNATGPENDLKWGAWDGEWGDGFNQPQTLAGLRWMQENDLHIRGHVLVWPGQRNLPDSINNLLPTRDASVPQRVLDHIDNITQATKAFVQEWDVINEPYDNHDLMDVYGPQVMVDWFNQARQNLPDASLYLNDYSILSARGRDTAHQQHLEDVVRYLLENNAPIDGIGFQGHMGEAPTEPTKLWEVLERYATAFPDLDFKITEFDVTTTDLDYQARYARDFITLVFSHPQVAGLQFWGFWEGAHWRSEAAMFRLDWSEKPIVGAYRDLVFNQWWTHLDGRANSMGEYRNRAFYGRHRVIAELNGITKAVEIDLLPGSGEFEIRLDENPSPVEPILLIPPLSYRTAPGGTARFRVELIAYPSPEYRWFHQEAGPNGLTRIQVGEDSPILEITNARPEDAGVYWLEVWTNQGLVRTNDFVLGVKAPPFDDDRLVNISTRGKVMTGPQKMIAGFVLGGTESKEILVRAIGPQLGLFGLTDTVADPILELYRVTTPQEPVMARNEAWETGNDPTVISETSTRVGAFSLETSSKDAVLHLVLEPGKYTAQVSAGGGLNGIGLIEVYDADEASAGLPLGTVKNISTRGQVGTGSEALIAGFVVDGDAPKPVLIRGIGPTLGKFGVPGTLSDPELTLFKKVEINPGQFIDQVVLTNNDWNEAPDPEAIRSATTATGAFDLVEGSQDATLLLWLEPGAYTVRLKGHAGETGIALVEVYAID